MRKEWEGALLRTLNLAFAVPWLTLLGRMAAADRRFPAWGGALVGTRLGTSFGPAFGGALPRFVADYCFGPEVPAEAEVREP